jgi:hypothetical protein
MQQLNSNILKGNSNPYISSCSIVWFRWENGNWNSSFKMVTKLGNKGIGFEFSKGTGNFTLLHRAKIGPGYHPPVGY